MRASEIKKKKKEELERILKEKKVRLQKLRFDLSAGKLKNVREIRKIKKEIARILTILRETP
ncbi:hypothetical protein AMJ49_01790 [Parcubacteria bacterium DG_74_2]|nr:MAG: hypothetical protein AMJ49_01790 [Parcubacteria bacterium DG_74_2]